MRYCLSRIINLTFGANITLSQESTAKAELVEIAPVEVGYFARIVSDRRHKGEAEALHA